MRPALISMLACERLLARAPIDGTSARELAEVQLRTIVSSLALLEGLESVLAEPPARDRRARSRRPRALSTLAHRFVETMAGFRRESRGLDVVGPATRALHDLLRLYRAACREGASDEQVLAGTFLVGHGFFEVLALLGADCRDAVLGEGRVSRSRVSPRRARSERYVEELEQSFRLHARVVRRLAGAVREARADTIWERVHEYWLALPPECREAVSEVVSLRRRPARRPHLVTVAQVAHWEGWGGDGRLFEALAAGRHSRFFDLLARYRSLALDWHRSSAPGRGRGHFSSKQVFFADAAQQLARYTAECTALLLVHPKLRAAADNRASPLRIWADGVGPRCLAEARIIEEVARETAAAGRPPLPLELTATETSGPCLEALVKEERAALENGRLWWRDLNRPFPGEPGRSAGERAPAGAYDCYSCAVALHQVADGKLGQERIRSIFAFATRIVRAGGVLSMPDVGRGAALQVFFIPLNLVDREGGWGGDIFSIPRPGGAPRHTFRDVACDLEGRFLARGARSMDAAARVKLPLPLVSLSYGTPETLFRRDMAIYEFVPYLVIDLALGDLRALEDRWRRSSRRDKAHLAAAALERWRPGSSKAIGEIVKQLRRRGYAPASLD